MKIHRQNGRYTFESVGSRYQVDSLPMSEYSGSAASDFIHPVQAPLGSDA